MTEEIPQLIRVLVYGTDDRIIADRLFADADALAEAEKEGVFSDRVRQDIPASS